jgi:hypothetical protein
MAIYTVHEPPQTRSPARRAPDRFAFVRDGFHFWAFLVPPVWMLLRRLWLVLVAFVALTAALQFALHAVDASESARFWAQLLLAALIGLEAATLRRWTLRRNGWRDAGIVSGDGLETAERRFFAAWMERGRSTSPPPVPAAATSPTPAPPRSMQVPPRSEIVGLFPEPETPR